MSNALTTAQLIAVIAGSGAIATLLLKVLQSAERVWRSTIGSRADWRRRLYRLDQGITVEFLESMLGIPTFRDELGDGHRAMTYLTKYALVKAEIDPQGTVVGYAICVTTRLKLKASRLSFDRIKASLGKSTFGQVEGLPKEKQPTIRGYMGASRTFYSELYYGARPGAYRSYVIANNWIGFRGGIENVPFLPRDHADAKPETAAHGQRSPGEQAAEGQRLLELRTAASGAVVNTLAVVGVGGTAQHLEINREEFHLWRPTGRIDRFRRWRRIRRHRPRWQFRPTK